MTYVFAIAIAGTLALVSVVIHFEALSILNTITGKLQSHRKRIVYAMFGLLLTHALEIWMYGGVYAALSYWPAIGQLNNQSIQPAWFDPIYYSAMVYTTVGFGDIIPQGPLRLITATEALVGLSLITWSASYTFILMQKVWR